MTIGRYQRTNWLIPIIGKMADTNYQCISSDNIASKPTPNSST